MAEEERDSHTKQLYTILRRSAKIFAAGYCYSSIDAHVTFTADHAVQLIMVHMERNMAMLSDMLAIQWSADELYTIEMDVREVCEAKLNPF